MSEITIFYCLKIFHIGALIFWLGPSIGGWWILRGLRKHIADDEPLGILSHKLFIHLLILEHIAFAVLLATGISMAILFGFFQQVWLHWKLLLIVIFVLPLEVMDIYLGNFKLARALNPQKAEHSRYAFYLKKYHNNLTLYALIVLPVVVLLIFWLVITKPSF